MIAFQITSPVESRGKYFPPKAEIMPTFPLQSPKLCPQTFNKFFDFKKRSEEKSSFLIEFWLKRLNSKNKQNVSCVK